MITIKPVNEVSYKSQTVELQVWVVREFLDVHEALLLEILIDLLLLLAGLSLHTQIEIDQEVTRLLFDISDLAVDGDAP